MCRNLDVSHYQNGDSIPEVRDPDEWRDTRTGAWCYYNNDPQLGEVYGKLYNWYAVNDPRGLAPEGWHIPSLEEWQTLSDFLGGDSISGGKLKEVGTEHWDEPNIGATNETNFTALAAGTRQWDGLYQFLGASTVFWVATERDNSTSYKRQFRNGGAMLQKHHADKTYGYSVRCVKTK